MVETSKNIYHVDLDSLDSITLEEARKRIESDLQQFNGSPVLIRMPEKYNNFKTYKALLSHLFTLTNSEKRLVSDKTSFNLCELYASGMIAGDHKSGYYLSIK